MKKMVEFLSQLTNAQRIGYGLVVLCLFIVLFEISGLLYLRSQVGRYQQFWDKKASETGEIVYVALGDSAAQGIGATSPMRGYVGLIAKQIEQQTGRTVQVVNLSRTGAKINDVLNRQLSELEKIESPDLITIEIGANNVKGLDEAEFRKQYQRLIESLPPGTFIADVPDFGGGPLLDPQNRASEIAREEIAKRSDLRFVALEAETEARFRHWLDHSFDFFHPDNNGYNIWADAFMEEINLHSNF